MHFVSLRAVSCESETERNFRLWDPLTGQTSAPSSFTESNTWVATVSADRRLVALGHSRFHLHDSTLDQVDLTIWDMGQHKQTARLERAWVTGWGAARLGDAVAAFSPDNRWLAVFADTNVIRCWEIEKSQTPVDLCRVGDRILSWSIAPDSSRLVTSYRTGAVCIWELSSGKLLLTLEDLHDPVGDAALAPDGKTLATVCHGAVQVWDLQHLAKVADLSGSLLGFRLVAFSPDGTRLAACTAESDIKVWELSHYQEVATLRGHNEWHERLGFTADGDVLISMGYEGVHLWRAAPLNQMNASHEDKNE